MTNNYAHIFPIHPLSFICIRSHIHIHTDIHSHTHIIHTQKHTYIRIGMHTHIHTRTFTDIHSHTHIQTYIRTYIQTCMQIHSGTNILSLHIHKNITPTSVILKLSLSYEVGSYPNFNKTNFYKILFLIYAATFLLITENQVANMLSCIYCYSHFVYSYTASSKYN